MTVAELIAALQACGNYDAVVSIATGFDGVLESVTITDADATFLADAVDAEAGDQDPGAVTLTGEDAV